MGFTEKHVISLYTFPLLRRLDNGVDMGRSSTKGDRRKLMNQTVRDSQSLEIKCTRGRGQTLLFSLDVTCIPYMGPTSHRSQGLRSVTVIAYRITLSSSSSETASENHHSMDRIMQRDGFGYVFSNQRSAKNMQVFAVPFVHVCIKK